MTLVLFFYLGNVLAIAQVQPKYSSIEEQAAALRTYYKKLKSELSITEAKKLQYGKLFLEAFPASLQVLKKLDHLLSPYQQSKYFELFYKLRYNDKEVYFNRYIDLAIDMDKYIDLAIKMEWNGELNLTIFSKLWYRKLFYNTEIILSILSKRPEEEIISFFHFILTDPLQKHLKYGIHPDPWPRYLENERMHQKLRAKIEQASPIIAQLSAVKTLLDQYTKVEERTDLLADGPLETLTQYYEEALNCTGKQRAKYERRFFKAFPSTFAEMKALYGFQQDEILQRACSFFFILEHIDKTSYYNKCIDLCIERPWNLDFGLSGKMIYILVHDTKKMISLLAKRRDKEIKSVFRFLFDGPHPNNEFNEANYNKLYVTIKTINSRIAQLIKEVYEQILSEEHCLEY